MANLNSRIGSFWKGQKTSGATGLAIVLACLEHWRDTGDARPLARFMKGAKDYPSDERILKAIIRFAAPTAKVKADSSNEFGMVFSHPDGGGVALSNEYSRLADMAEAGESFRGEKVKSVVMPKKKKAEFDEDKYIRSIAAKLVSEGVELAPFMDHLRRAVAMKKVA